MTRRSTKGQAGFIITLELVLIFTILGLGVMVGIVAIRNALFKFFLHKKAAEIYVVDSGTPQRILGKAFDLDEHEAPRLQFVDRSVNFGNVTVNRRVIVGVRDDRFTTRHRIFYENSNNCGVTTIAGAICNTSTCQACIVHNGDEEGDSNGVGIVPLEASDGVTTVTGSTFVTQAGGIGYLYPMQGGPSYGIGRDVEVDLTPGLPGTLYRETGVFCDPTVVRSVWTSQDVVSGFPCRALPAGVTVEPAKCPGGATPAGAVVGGACRVPPADARRVVGGTCTAGQVGEGCSSDVECGGGANSCDFSPLQCNCPFTADGNDANDWIIVGANCCPPGSDTTPSTPGQCEIGNTGHVRDAVIVTGPGGAPALSLFEPPFRVSVPVEVDATFQAREPGGFEGAPPGSVIPGGIDVDSIDYTTPPAGGESGPP